MKTHDLLHRVSTRKFEIFLIGALAIQLGSVGCSSPGKRTAFGAGAGAAAGGAVGGAAGGWKGAGIGAGIGAIAGGAVGNYLDKQAKELEKVADTKRTANGILVNLKNDLLFDTGKANLKASAQTQLTQLGEILIKYPQNRIRIEGFTDSTGSPDFNEQLSERRAESVREVLSQQGVSPSQMSVDGYGPSRPVASNQSAVGRAKNRRVELFIDVPEANIKS